MKYILLLLDILFYFDKKCVAFTIMGKTAWIGYQNHRRHSKTEKKNVSDINEIECLDSFIQCRYD